MIQKPQTVLGIINTTTGGAQKGARNCQCFIPLKILIYNRTVLECPGTVWLFCSAMDTEPRQREPSGTVFTQLRNWLAWSSLVFCHRGQPKNFWFVVCEWFLVQCGVTVKISVFFFFSSSVESKIRDNSRTMTRSVEQWTPSVCEVKVVIVHQQTVKTKKLLYGGNKEEQGEKEVNDLQLNRQICRERERRNKSVSVSSSSLSHSFKCMSH